MRLRPALSIFAALSFLLLALPAGASAQDGFTQITVPKPTGVAFDPYSPHVFIPQVGPPPGVQVWHQNDDGSADFEALIPLPADSDPGDIYYDSEDDTYIVQDHAKDRYFEVCANCGSVTVHDLAVNIQFATGIAYGYNNWVMSDFGDGTSAGSLFYGPGFTSQLLFGDTIVPNGVALLTGTGPVKHGNIPSEFLVIDAQNNGLVEVSDAKTPAVIGTEPGPPGAGGLKPARDVAVDPVNLNSNPLAAATHLVLVPVPDLGNVYASRNGTGTWQAISSTAFGRPTRVDADCEHIGVTDFTNNVVTIFNEKPPKKSECEDIVDLIVGAGSGAPLTAAGQFKVGIKAFVDAGGDVNASFSVGGFATKRAFGRGAERAVLAKKATSRSKKVRLTAGKLKKVKLKFSGHAKSALFAALQQRHKAVGTLKLRVKTASGRKATVKQRIRIRVAH
ncbi:MAG: hypothetical protein M3R23_00470 [Actinomycetota bacterium]|nr:hypothetical protein [Actinomycetota bacterium]